MSADHQEASYRVQLEALIEDRLITRSEAPAFTPRTDGSFGFDRVLLVTHRNLPHQIRQLGVHVKEPRKLDAYLNWIRRQDQSPYLVLTQEGEDQMRGIDNSRELPLPEQHYNLAEGLALLRSGFVLGRRLVLTGSTFKTHRTDWPDAAFYISQYQSGPVLGVTRYPLARDRNAKVPTFVRSEVS